MVIFASNRGITTIRGTNFASPHGMPVDLLDRLLIVYTEPYTAADVAKIIDIRIREEDVTVDDSGKAKLVEIATSTSLRYAMHLMTASALVCAKRGGTAVSVADVERVYSLFVDVKRSEAFLQQHEQLMMPY